MFSKSKSKRFQEPSAEGPAVGQYDVKDIKAKTNSVSFIKDKRWREKEGGNASFGSLENVSDSGFSFGRRPSIPLSHSTCVSKKVRRKSCFPVSNSASDLRSCRQLNLSRSLEDDLGDMSNLKEQQRRLEIEIESLKAQLDKTKMENCDLKSSLDDLLNEKLEKELHKQTLNDKLSLLTEAEELKVKETASFLISLEASATRKMDNVVTGLANFFDAFCKKQLQYQDRLDTAKSRLVHLEASNRGTFQKLEISQEKLIKLEEEYEILMKEKTNKEVAIEDQERKITEAENSLSSLMNRLSSKEDTCCSMKNQLEKLENDKVEKNKEFSIEKEEIVNKMTTLENIHKQKVSELENEILSMKSLNHDYERQISSVQQSMTENIKEISRKYENLEESFCQTQKGYRERLDRSKALVARMTCSNATKTEEFENLRNLYTKLQEEYRDLLSVNQSNDEIILEKKNEIASHKHAIALLNAELVNVKDGNEALVNEAKKQSQNFKEQLSAAEERSKKHEMEVKYLKDKLASYEFSVEEEKEKFTMEICQLKHELSDYKMKSVSYEEKIVVLTEKNQIMEKQFEEECRILKEEEERLIKECNRKEVSFNEEISNLQQELVEMKSIAENQSGVSQEEVDRLLSKLEESAMTAEQWKAKFEDLELKVGPFMDQLEQYEFEKQHLMSQNMFSQQEMKRLSEKYGQILGHQNNKQKIRHISKLKEENLQLKADLLKLRALSDKDRIKISQLESQSKGRKFDPSKSFCPGGKENRDVLKSQNR